jgi:hypothetical protein
MARATVRCDRDENREEPEYSFEQIKKALAQQHACYVLITCSAPSSDGNMDVAMCYEGDDALAAYLVHSTHQMFEERMGAAGSS